MRTVNRQPWFPHEGCRYGWFAITRGKTNNQHAEHVETSGHALAPELWRKSPNASHGLCEWSPWCEIEIWIRTQKFRKHKHQNLTTIHTSRNMATVELQNCHQGVQRHRMDVMDYSPYMWTRSVLKSKKSENLKIHPKSSQHADQKCREIYSKTSQGVVNDAPDRSGESFLKSEKSENLKIHKNTNHDTQPWSN